MPWGTALHQYATAQRAAGRSAGTINLHRHYLRNLAETVRAPWRATVLDLVDFVSREGWAPETRKSARAAVRGFYRWGHGMGYLDDDPAEALPPVRVPAGIPRPTPEHLVAQLVARGDRLGFMAQLAAHGGLRRGEIARVHGRDLVVDVLVVQGKGGKVREVPVIDRTLLRRLQRVQLADDWAFPNGLGGHLSAGHVGRMLSAAMPEGWTAHTLRHRLGTAAYAGTRDLLAVQQLLGHSRPETTQRYVRIPDDAVRAAAAAAC